MRPSYTSRRRALKAKRLFDLSVSTCLLIALAPMMLMVALLCLLTQGWPIFVALERVGRSGRTFKIYKFRSMVNGADFHKRTVYGEPGCDYHKRPDDPRITALGRILRHTSLDELPQLVNVLRGEMSLVGPRPEGAGDVANRTKYFTNLREFQPGMTGLAQIYGRKEPCRAWRDHLNGWYVRLWCLKLDLAILLRTIPVVWRGHGAL